MAIAEAWRSLEGPAASAKRAFGWLRSPWLWAGLGLVVAGMARQDFDLELRGFPRGWRATFYPSGLAHSIVAGTGWASSPWRAAQRAAWIALARESPRVA